MIGIVKGLWGDHSLVRRNVQPPQAFELVKDGVRAFTETGKTVDAVYAFGQDNFDFLSSLGLSPMLVSHKSWAAPERPKKRYNRRFYWNGSLRSGYSYWWHKFRIIKEAFKQFPDGVLWTDFDVLQTTDDLTWMRQDLENGKAIRASLYAQHNWTWGAGWRHNTEWNVPHTSIYDKGDTHAAARTVLGCGYLFFKSEATVDYALEIQDEFPHFLDHQVVSLLFDRLQGGEWIGTDAYIEQGWHTESYYYARQIHPPRRSKTCFQAGKREKRVTL